MAAGLLATHAIATVEYDQDVTPTIIFGAGNNNGAFTTDRFNGVEIGLRAKLRYDENGVPQNVFNSNGDGSYTFYTRSRPNFPDGQRGEWSFEWAVNTDFDGSSLLNLDDLSYELGLDADPGPGTNFLVFDPITPSAEAPCWDHAIGNNGTGNGGGTAVNCITDPNPGQSYAGLLTDNNVAQNSWQYGFFLIDELADYDPRLPGRYTIYLQASNGSGVVARSEIEVIVVDPPLAFDQNVTPEAIFGSGNANGEFTTDRRNDIELGLRGKLRYNASGVPENTFNSNGDGTYSFAPRLVPGGSPLRAEWGFEWSVNTNYQGGAGPNVDAYTYELGLDADPSLGTDFLVFDPITPTAEVPCWDHAMGNNGTPNGGGTSANCLGDPNAGATYQNLIANNNVAQNSWRYEFFASGPIAGFDPTVDGSYRIYLAAYNADGVEVARSDIDILVGSASGGTVSDVELSMSTTATGTQFTGDAITYQLVASNTDLAKAANVSILNVLPDNLSFVAGSCDDGSVANVAGQSVDFALADLPSGASTICTIDTVVASSGTIVNSASVAADNDGDANNNAASVRLLGVIESVALTGDIPSPTDNDYTRINDVVQIAGPGDQIVLNGVFDWNESNAFASWALGSDGIDGTVDDWTIYVPDGLADLTITATAPGDATIKGPGDLAGVDLEGFLLVYGTNPGLEISNLVIEDFDVAIGIYYNGGGVNVYDNLTIIDNFIAMPRDVAGNSQGGEAFQNIGIHYSFGDNILIARNVIEIPGDSASTASLRAAQVAMQSNTSGGAYEGLVIEDNEIRILLAQAEIPAGIIGIWENGNAHTSNITVRNNRFINLDPANDPSLNDQEAFRITSHSSASSTTRYEGNYAEGANVGYGWLSFDTYGADFSTRDPIEFVSNTAVDNLTGILIDSNGAADLSCNRIHGNDLGLSNITQAGRISLADDNWWGCNAGPNAGDCDAYDTGLTTDRWLVAGLTADAGTVLINSTTGLNLDLRSNSDGNEVTSCTLPATPVILAANEGSVTPAVGATSAALLDADYTAPGFATGDTVTVTVDAEVLTVDFTVELPVDSIFNDRFEN
ncbi:DUF11 domain-containing protein [Wenzhouxiangella marina]|uniref:Uncharacterized protein n=1 Tax=Wenzhouxiangella marina TaxID=1579979 RepID=A0A0K0XU67_9GAMM|nr:DUF11 domain-containing protein [Wenzhouxiangella marina]AKS41218.1 hypothetical protein WM2015_837 [Wenzhouxiangella marina]MBB6088098.1 putative repeat protein (TIGR01451 family) [Wenzhouxiangella marina]